VRCAKRKDEALDDEVMDALPSAHDDPAEQHFRETHRDAFKQAFAHAIASLTPQQRNLLKHRFVDDLTVEQIGGLYGVHKATVSRWLDSARLVLAKRTKTSFQQATGATPSEMRSLVRVLESNVELSLRRRLS
jgi:RNA polymerase sigma-70 factor (ECF subfamily)